MDRLQVICSTNELGGNYNYFQSKFLCIWRKLIVYIMLQLDVLEKIDISMII